MNKSEQLTLSKRCEGYFYRICASLGRLRGRIRRAGYAYERRTTLLPVSVRSVLFVCKGNICRSPLAAVCFQTLAKQEAFEVTVWSAGLETTPGKPAHANAKCIGLENGLSLDLHLTTQLHAKLVNQSDLIVVMELAQKNRIHRLYPQAKGKVVLLGAFDSQGPLEVADPYSGTLDDFRTCLSQIEICCKSLVTRIKTGREASSVISMPKANQ